MKRDNGNQLRRNLKLTVDYVALEGVTVPPGNPRRHSTDQIARIAASMAAHGNINPILVDAQLRIIAGVARYEAARLNSLEQVPIIRLGHLSEAEKRRYRIADNRLAELSAWSVPDLVAEFALVEMGMPDLDLSLTGFTLDEIDGYRDLEEASTSDQEELPPPVKPDAPVTRFGDLWQVDDHLLVCGDATSTSAYQQLLGRERPGMVFADPPYNVPIRGHVSGLGKNHHREFVQASGEMSAAEFQAFLLSFMQLCARFARPGALHYICIDWRHIQQLLQAGLIAYDELVNLCVWAKTQGGMGSLYRSAHELIAVLKKGKVVHRNNVKLGASGRNRTNVWTYAGMNTPTRERADALALHPTCKPLALVRDAILDVTARGDIVLDPFGGSGTTLLAAARAGRVARLIELDPLYCDVILRRAAKTLGVAPVLRQNGATFKAVAAERTEEVAYG